MAWNPSPKVADCRTIARKWGYSEVIIIALDDKAGTIEMATYGETRQLCLDAKNRGDAAFDAVRVYGEEATDSPLFWEN